MFYAEERFSILPLDKASVSTKKCAVEGKGSATAMINDLAVGSEASSSFSLQSSLRPSLLCIGMKMAAMPCCLQVGGNHRSKAY